MKRRILSFFVVITCICMFVACGVDKKDTTNTSDNKENIKVKDQQKNNSEDKAEDQKDIIREEKNIEINNKHNNMSKLQKYLNKSMNANEVSFITTIDSPNSTGEYKSRVYKKGEMMRTDAFDESGNLINATIMREDEKKMFNLDYTNNTATVISTDMDENFMNEMFEEEESIDIVESEDIEEDIIDAEINISQENLNGNEMTVFSFTINDMENGETKQKYYFGKEDSLLYRMETSFTNNSGVMAVNYSEYQFKIENDIFEVPSDFEIIDMKDMYKKMMQGMEEMIEMPTMSEMEE